MGRSVRKLESVYDEIEAAGTPTCGYPARIWTGVGCRFRAKSFRRRQPVGAAGFGALCRRVPRPVIRWGKGLDEWLQMFRVKCCSAGCSGPGCPWALLKASPMLRWFMCIPETHAAVPSRVLGWFSVSKHAGAFWAANHGCRTGYVARFRINTIIPGPLRSPFRIRTHPVRTRPRCRISSG